MKVIDAPNKLAYAVAKLSIKCPKVYAVQCRELTSMAEFCRILDCRVLPACRDYCWPVGGPCPMLCGAFCGWLDPCEWLFFACDHDPIACRFGDVIDVPWEKLIDQVINPGPELLEAGKLKAFSLVQEIEIPMVR